MPENEFQLYLRQSNRYPSDQAYLLDSGDRRLGREDRRQEKEWMGQKPSNKLNKWIFLLCLGSKRRDNVLSFSYSLKEQKVLPQQCYLWGYGSLVGARLPIESTKVIYKKKSC